MKTHYDKGNIEESNEKNHMIIRLICNPNTSKLQKNEVKIKPKSVCSEPMLFEALFSLDRKSVYSCVVAMRWDERKRFYPSLLVFPHNL